MFKDLIGTKKFYKRVIMIALPIMIQNAITNFVNMLDNIMVGSVGNAQMTGVAISNQLIFVFNLCIFGAISGAGIFGSQFYGKRDHKGMRHTFRFKIIFCTLLTLAGIYMLRYFSDFFISLYLEGDGDPELIEQTLSFAKEYLFVMLIGLIPYTLAQCYASSLREMGKTVPPMIAGVSAVVINLFFNWVLIFGKLGAPVLGVKGAAIATVMSRFAELLIVVFYTHTHKKDIPFIVGAYRSLKVPIKLTKQIFIKGLPLMANEAFWALGVATVNKYYTLRGYEVVTANNISQTFFNVFSVAFMSVGVAIGIIIGQHLGAGELSRAKREAKQLIFFSVLVSVLFGAIYFFCAYFIPYFYNTTDATRHIATQLMQVTALVFPLDAFVHASYFTLRSGGKTFITFVFDSGYMWVVSVVAAFLLVNFTTIPIVPLFAICQSLNIIKCAVGFVLIKKGVWVKNMLKEVK